MMKYEKLSEELSARIAEDLAAGKRSPHAFCDRDAVRRDRSLDRASVLRPPFIRDADKILHCPYYNRYADKTQVFSLYKNDDITRRGLHVQLVSRISRTISRALGLNLELTEAIALGHDIGHTPFGHAGERFLDELLCEHTGNRFSHNIQSVAVLDRIFPYNITLQTLSGIAAHDGELELETYRPAPLSDFSKFDEQIKACERDKTAVRRLLPSTLEGCVVRVSDIIAYLGKDRQDAERAGLYTPPALGGEIGSHNAEIINNLIVNIVENSYGKPYIKLDPKHFGALEKLKSENYELIYKNEAVSRVLEEKVRPMMRRLYEKLLSDLKNGRRTSPVFSHHIDYINAAHYSRPEPYEATDKNIIIADYIASMTDDYFIELYGMLFPSSPSIKYVGYFDL